MARLVLESEDNIGGWRGGASAWRGQCSTTAAALLAHRHVLAVAWVELAGWLLHLGCALDLAPALVPGW